jgi:hypothetical protein
VRGIGGGEDSSLLSSPDFSYACRRLNTKLEERGRTLDGRPIWRLTWSTSQREKRKGKFSDYYGNIFLREVEQVREVPKYWNNPNRWVLERLCFLPPNASIHREVLSQTSDLDIFSPTMNGTYEPIYFFQDGLGNPLPVTQSALDAIMHALEFGKRVHLTDSDFREEQNREIREDARYFEGELQEAGRSPLFAFENSVFMNSKNVYKERVKPDDILLNQNRSRDICTVVSMLPYPLCEEKPGLVPGTFKIPYTAPGDITLLNVERCTHAVYLDSNRPRLIVTDPSDLVAKSIAYDHKVAMICYEAGIAEPGIDWVWGEYLPDQNGKQALAAANPTLLKEMLEKQMEWYTRLLKMADDDWATYRKHKFITDLQRTAARVLGQLDREWMLEQRIEESLSKCKFCFSQVHPEACICYSCHGILDQERYKKEFLGVGTIEKVAPAAQTVRPANT